MPRRALLALASVLMLAAGVSPDAARAAEAFFPGLPPATQVTRDLTLPQAAQQGLVKLESKGGGGEGDLVSLELQGKKARGAITVTVRVEMTVDVRKTPAEREAGVVKLLQLNAQLQPSLTASVTGMQAAIWNLTDASPLELSGSADESRALLAQAGVAENSAPGGLPRIGNPNAGNPATGAVAASGEVLPSSPAEAATPPDPVSIDTAQLLPSRLRAGRRVRGDLLVGVKGELQRLAVRIERRARRGWRRVRSLASRSLDARLAPVSIALGRLITGRYRLVVAVSGSTGDPAEKRVQFTVRR